MIDLLRLVVLLLVPLFVSLLIARTGRAAPRAPESSTGTLAKTFWTNSCALASEPYRFSA